MFRGWLWLTTRQKNHEISWNIADNKTTIGSFEIVKTVQDTVCFIHGAKFQNPFSYVEVHIPPVCLSISIYDSFQSTPTLALCSTHKTSCLTTEHAVGCLCHVSEFQWIGGRENLQETTVFPIFYMGLSYIFVPLNQSIENYNHQCYADGHHQLFGRG